MIHQTIETCRQLIDNPDARKEFLLRTQHNSRGLVGYFSNYIPQEIIAAAGFYPLRMIGSFKSSQSHRHTLFNPVCSFVQDVYAAAGSGEFAMLSHIVFPNSCDSLKVLQQLWNSEIKNPPAYTVLHPVNTGADSIRYFADQLKIFATHLQAAAGSPFTETSLVEVIEKYNLTRRLLRQLYHIRRTNKNFMLGSDLFALMTAGLIMDRDEYNRILTQIVCEAQNHASAENRGSVNIMLIGPLLDNLQLLEQIEQCGAYILDDDVTNGSRYFDLDVRTQGDVYNNLAERYLRSGPSPTLCADPQTDIQSFQDRVSGLDLDGVLFINQKFCEPHVHNYLAKADCLKQLGIRSLMLEIEHNRSGADERDLLRIESFLEIFSGSS